VRAPGRSLLPRIMTRDSAAGSAWLWGRVIGGLAVVYFLPVIIGAARKVEHLAVIGMLSMFPLAWPAALAGALILPRRQPAAPYPAHDYGPAPYPPPGSGGPYG
jgi:hypothetical protein